MNRKRERLKGETFEEILNSKVQVSGIEYIKDILSSMSSIVCILNEQNEVIFANQTMLDQYDLDLEKNVLGVRPGRVFNCIYERDLHGECGTSERCEYCGAKNAFDRARESLGKVTRECRITSERDGELFQLDLEITVTPVQFDKKYLIVSIKNITDKKRKAILERIFFHDILNIAGGLNNMLELLPEVSAEKKETFLKIAVTLSHQIVDEIEGQQQMVKAENGELQPEFKNIRIEKLLKKLANQIQYHRVSQEKKTKIIDETQGAEVYTDETLLTRVLINMVKNAMEAVRNGGNIDLIARVVNNKLRISVHNNTYIPREIQMQIFQRSYSTKGADRGVGTYSMKLLGENYLKGRVDFFSTESEGTTFFIELPIS